MAPEWIRRQHTARSARARRWIAAGLSLLLGMPAFADELPWVSPSRFRIPLTVDARGRERSHSPASVDLNIADALKQAGAAGRLDESTIEVIAYDSDGKPRAFDRRRTGDERYLLPWHLDTLYGADSAGLSFVMPDHTAARYAVYFDTIDAGRSKPKRYQGLVGDGDLFVETYGRREIGASSFDAFCDLDGDGDLDLFKGGVEPYVYCHENVGRNRFEPRGRLASEGKVLTLPHDEYAGRSWVSLGFDDWDNDGDADLLASFSTGPMGGRIVVYENVTSPGKPLAFASAGPMTLDSDELLASGGFAKPTVADFDGDGRKDLLFARDGKAVVCRRVVESKNIGDIRVADGEAVQADGKEIALGIARFELADIDRDGDLDLFAGTKGGPAYLFRNTGTREKPVFEAGVTIAYEVPILITDAYTGVHVADFDGDGLLDFAVGRFWERTPISLVAQPRDFGGLFKNVGTPTAPKFRRRGARAGSPYTERFQPCDAVRQNCVRAVDWDNDGKLDLLAGDTDGFITYFRNTTGRLFPIFENGRRLKAGGEVLSRYSSGGHARPDVVDWNNDGLDDLIVADGGGNVVVYLATAANPEPVLASPIPVEAGGKPIHGTGGRSSVIACDWDHDGLKDVVFADQNDGHIFFRNQGSDDKPVLAAGEPILFDGRPADPPRPNLGEYADWDGDEKPDFIACLFENEIRFHKDLSDAKPGTLPRFGSVEGVPIIKPFTVQMVSGADVIDFNGDGDLDILTGQGHGGSGLRFYERDFIEDGLADSRPIVTAEGVESRAISPGPLRGTPQ